MARNPYVVGIVVLQSGERLPMLRYRANGIPLFEPMLYALTELRARNRATATIQQALRAVMTLYLALDRLKVDLGQRLHDGRLLELGEVEEIVRSCRDSLESGALAGSSGEPRQPAKVSSLEKARMRTSNVTSDVVAPATAATRVRYIREYLNWLATDRLLKLGRKHANYDALKSTTDVVCRALDERVPPSGHRNTVNQRMGLTPEGLSKLMEVIEPTSPDNPWMGVHARERNALMVKWLRSLGLRRGELAGIRTTDINFQKNEVLIRRRADDRNDPRKLQPNAKTNDRLLPLSDDLAVLTHRYIRGARRAIKGARKHDFLFVANGSGAPLSLSAVNKIFVALRRECPDLPENLAPHILRHSWNDSFSEVMDQKQVSEESEKKMRSRLMGWSETSNMAATYTRRHTQKKAREAVLELQKKITKGDRDEA